MAAKNEFIRLLNEDVHRRPRPTTPRPKENPVGQRPDSGKPTGTDNETKE